MKKILATIVAVLTLSVSAVAMAGQNDLVLGKYTAAPYVELKGGNSWNDNSVYDNQAVYGAAAGLDFGPIRTEIEYARFDMGKNGGRLGNVNVDSLVANLYIEPYTINSFTPYVMTGVGYGWFNGTAVNPNTRGSVLLNLGAGTTYAINEKFALDVGYRYTASTESSIVAKTSNVGDSFVAHTLLTGVRYNF